VAGLVDDPEVADRGRAVDRFRYGSRSGEHTR